MTSDEVRNGKCGASIAETLQAYVLPSSTICNSCLGVALRAKTDEITQFEIYRLRRFALYTTRAARISPCGSSLTLAAIYSRGTYRPTTIDAPMFHFRVRNGTGWGHWAMTTRLLPYFVLLLAYFVLQLAWPSYAMGFRVCVICGSACG